jgi:phosphoglucosamine mutase
MAKNLFGTDGIRAVAGQYPLTPPFLAALGQALAGLLAGKGLPPRVLIGRDTRESGPWMERAVASGLRGAGGEAASAGVIPTSAISYLVKTHGFGAGIVISASHNPFRDNGVKVFSPLGIKIPDEWEEELEGAATRVAADPPGDGEDVPFSERLVDDYVEYLKSRVRVDGGPKRIKVVLDCSNGASSAVAPRVFRELGFEVTTIHARPDGTNINLGCGSLHPEELAAAVVENGADLGVAYDGDADRALFADEAGRLLTGDHTLFVVATLMKRARRLRSDCVVATTMSNMGLERALGEIGLKLVRTQVGDKYVYEGMIARGANLGGERSGHTIFLDDLPTGDGILTSLKVIGAMVIEGRGLAELVRDYREYPQILVNVPVGRKIDFREFPEIGRAVEAVRGRLGDDGRLDLRYSGTEPLARVMVEAGDQELVESCARQVADAVRKHLGDGT